MIQTDERLSPFFKGDLAGASETLSKVTGRTQMQRLQAEVDVLQELLDTVFVPEGGTDILATFGDFVDDLSKIDKTSPATERMIEFYNQFAASVLKGRQEMAELGDVSAETRAETVITALLLQQSFEQNIAHAYRLNAAQNAILGNLKRQAEFAINRLELEKELGRLTIESRTKLATEGLAPIFKEKALLDQIIQQRNLDLSIAERRASLDIEILRRRRAAAPALEQTAIDTEIEKIRDRLISERESVRLAAERELITQRIALSTEQQAEFLKIQESNAQARLQGVRELLTDIDLLTSGAAFETFFGVPGQAFVERQADLLMDTLFNTRTGLLKEFSSVVGGTGEIITDAHVNGAVLAGPILTQAIVTGATSVLSRIPGFGFGPPAEGTGPAALSRIPGFGFAPLPTQFDLVPFPGFGLAPIPRQLPAAPEGTDLRATQLRQVAMSAATVAGNIAGSVLGGRGAGARAGAGFGTLAGGIAGGQLLGGALGSAAGPVGAAVGGILGGLIGGLFDNEEQQFKALEVIARNTGESVTLLENTNRLLEPQTLAFNLPATFRLPAFAPSNFGGGGGALAPGGTTSANTISVQNQISVTVDGTQSTTEVGKEIATAVSRELSLQLSSNGLYVPRV
jgi:hypothetical protein